VETTTGVPMAEETANALHVGIGVAATCIGVACSVYHCCCRVWRRLKGYTPTATVGAVAAAGLMAAGQLSSVTTVGPPPNRGDAVSGASGSCRATSAGDCQSAAQPQCSSSSGPQESSDCQASAQPRYTPASGTTDTGDCQSSAQPPCADASAPGQPRSGPGGSAVPAGSDGDAALYPALPDAIAPSLATTPEFARRGTVWCHASEVIFKCKFNI
jgi:hypothetical protein